MCVPQCAFQHGGGVWPARGGVDAFLRQQKRNVAKECVQLHPSLLVRHLEVALSQDLQADGVLIAGAKDLLQVFLLGQDALADVAKDGFRLQHLVEVLFTAMGGAYVLQCAAPHVHASAPVEHFVFVARNLKALAHLFVPHNGNVGQPLLSYAWCMCA